MGNKFLKLYPMLVFPCSGDKVKIVRVLNSAKQEIVKGGGYKKGDIGIIKDVYKPGYSYSVVFHNCLSYAVYDEEIELYYE
jgi:hypothetical protein